MLVALARQISRRAIPTGDPFKTLLPLVRIEAVLLSDGR
jgi:hypothetical protein